MDSKIILFVKNLSDSLGLNEGKLKLMNLHVDESNINEFGGLDLKSSLDFNKAISLFEKRTGIILSLRKVKLLADNEIESLLSLVDMKYSKHS